VTDIAAWNRRLAEYRQPDNWRSLAELMVTIVPFPILWAAMSIVAEWSYWACLMIATPTAGVPRAAVHDPA
jgi:acyl-lipid omega-6 desaturase (Delta-12 desaturase)